MAKKPFVVIDSDILTSSIWSEAPHVKLVWFTLLVLCDMDGYVGASVPGLAATARLSLDETKEALDKLMKPDEHSRTKTFDGRRLEVADRGFRILNFEDHIDRLSSERRKARERVRRFRKKRSGNVTETHVTLHVPREQGIENREQGKTAERTIPANPLLAGRRVEMERDVLAMIRDIHELTGDDPVEIIATASGYKGQTTTKLNPATMTDDRLANTWRDLKADLTALRKKQEAKHGNQAHG